MFAKLFAESGLSLDRLKALLEVGAAGSIVKAADGDPVRQSQYSRQIKELEDFFRTRLIERQGKGIRLTAAGRELARISRFFMLGLSNFQRGCLAEEQTFKIGTCATFARCYLVPALAGKAGKAEPKYVSEICSDEEIERRLHDLTLDFGIVCRSALSRPLQTRPLGTWRLELRVPRALRLNPVSAAKAFGNGSLPLALAKKELADLNVPDLLDEEAPFVCESFLEAAAAMEGRGLAALLPDFLESGKGAGLFMRVPLPNLDSLEFQFHIAWNPRLLRLNPHATRRRDKLAATLGMKR